MKNQAHMTPPKKYTKSPVTGPKDMEIQALLHKEFKTIALKMFRELQENTCKQFNCSRKIIHEENDGE